MDPKLAGAIAQFLVSLFCLGFILLAIFLPLYSEWKSRRDEKPIVYGKEENPYG